MMKDTLDGQTNYCPHKTSNPSGVCDVCLGTQWSPAPEEPICPRCSCPMINAYDPIAKKVSEYLWECKKCSGTIMSKG